MLFILLFAHAGSMRAETAAIDPASSVITVRVYKSGLFSMFAHDHLIQARGPEGIAERGPSPHIEIRLSARQLKVVDPGTSDRERAEIQQAMEDTVLEVNRYPEIRFQSTSIDAQAPGRFLVRGNLSLHGRTLPISLVVQGSGKSYKGKTTLRQTDFGIEPIKIAGGAIRVKDQISIEFDITMRDT